jgi:predicted alpha/beta-hydrolase family hydrolase
MRKLNSFLLAIGILSTSVSFAQDQQPGSGDNKATAKPLIGKASEIKLPPATTVVSVAPVVLSAPGRALPLEVRVTAPTTGNNLPVIIFSHGHGNSNDLSSLNGYAPLVNFWAAHGFIVIQPTHLDSKRLQLNSMNREDVLFWRSRAGDIKLILDQLNTIEKAVPEIKGRLDRSRIAMAGHSLGGFTASLLLGEEITNAKGEKVNMSDSRIKAGILLSAPGNGGADLSPMMAKVFVDYHPDFTGIKKPTLVVAGDRDTSAQETVRGPEWHTDPYKSGAGPKCLLVLTGGKHSLGGISGYDAAEATDENPERVALVQRLTWAYLRTALYPEDKSWADAAAVFNQLHNLGKLECK